MTNLEYVWCLSHEVRRCRGGFAEQRVGGAVVTERGISHRQMCGGCWRVTLFAVDPRQVQASYG